MLEAGEQFGRYQIISSIGAGGMGEVFLAEDTRLRRQVALKILPETFSSNKERLLRFEREALSASALNHPNILTIYEFDSVGELYFLASEFVKGETLHKQIQREALALSKILDLSTQIVSALQAAHSAGIMHRDIKPENIMIREDGIVKVLDFGLAKLVKPTLADEEAETRMQVQTQAGMIMGTVAYMSPEQARGKQVDFRTDIFSFGTMLYEMLTQRQPFTGETINHTIVAILEKDPAPLSLFIKDYPSEIEKIIFRCLAKNINERYPSAKDLLVDLKSLQKRLDFETDLKPTTQANTPTETKTQILRAKTDYELVQPTEELSKFNSEKIYVDKKSSFKWKATIGGVFLVLIGAVAFALFDSKNFRVQNVSTNQGNENSNNTQQVKPEKRYLEMSENEKQQFVSREADKILQNISSGAESEIPPPGKKAIKDFVDNYAKRSKFENFDSCGSKTFFQSDLTSVLKRGVKIAPDIIAGFKEKGIPAQVGIYLAMNESEFCPCLVAPTGALGIYQFSTQTAIDYGLKAVKGANPDEPDERCNPEPSSLAAASYIKKLFAEDFGNGMNQTTLAIAAYNSGENGLRANINKTKELFKNETISFWTLLENSNKQSDQFRGENVKYVPKFFASAIVGENPKVFDVEIQPLSLYLNK